MKVYWTIQGPNKAPQLPCIVFRKYDGNNFRAEWSRKRGWYKFGTRKTMIGPGDEVWGHSIEMFMQTYADDLTKVFTDNKELKKTNEFTVYCEYYGPNSFAGWHDPKDKDKNVILFDVNLYKKGYMSPRDFVKSFGHLKVAEVICECNFGKQFIQDVKDGKIVSECEGVVAKGVNPKKKPPHGLWMAKCKTRWWMEELERKVAENPEFFTRIFRENVHEQTEETQQMTNVYEQDEHRQIKAEVDRLGKLCIPDYKEIALRINSQFHYCLTPGEVKDIHRSGF